jgi:glycosyltransferase involved in cell wall biosynthesis
MNIALVIDCWTPQVNGVVRTYTTTVAELRRLQHDVLVIGPDRFRTVRCPTDGEYRLALGAGRAVARLLEAFQPNAVHIATEGPLGLAARNYCLRRGWPFTTSYTTKLPEYAHARLRLPLCWSYAVMRWFHRPARAVMVATATLERELAAQRFTNLTRWTRGVDTTVFRPAAKDFLDAPRPILLYVGRVAVEKNIRAFLDLPVPGTKYVVGSGPQYEQLRRMYPAVRFAGMQHGEQLARHYAAADVFVFPSKTDTFGLVMLEALACGVPVAAYPVPGPLDDIGDAVAGALDEDLTAAVQRALHIPPALCRAHAARFSWTAVATCFVQNLALIS